MEIKKRLKTPYADAPDAVLLNDEGEEYPVFLESLNNTIIFPMLMDSGYVLEKLPYGFVKNGVKLEDLPVEEFTPTESAEELMYNSIGVKIPVEELKQHIVVSAETMPLPPTNYTIFTREDLIKYLRACENAQLDDDFMPLNYFVAPDACFSIDEWRDPDNFDYVQIINDRRKMSLIKFTKLVQALREINLPANYTAMDVVDAYFAWGIDGLKFNIVSKHRESRAFRLIPNRNVNAPMSMKTYGFVDGAKNIFTPVKSRGIQWKLENSDPKFLDTVTSGMQANDTVLVGFTAGTKQEVTTLEGTNFNIRYSDEIILMQLRSYHTLLVQSPVASNEYIDLELALPNNREELYEYCTMEALARMVYNYRKPTVRVTSYDALKNIGCNPRTILDYIVTKYDMSKDIKVATEETAPQIFDYHIEDYLAGKELSDDIKSFLDDIVDGVFNIDNIEKGKQVEATVSTSSVYKEIYALHNVMGISFQEMYDKFRTITPEITSLTFSNESLNYTMDVTPMTYSLSGYKRDVMDYDIKNSKDCTFFTYVNLIAREVGDERARRHVGIEFYMVNKKYAPVKAILEDLENQYVNRVQSMIPDVTAQAKQLRMVHMFTLSRYFEIAMSGTITWPKILGGEVTTAASNVVSDARRYMERKIENITAYCSFTARTENARNLTFNAYCTNAYITPEYVIPRSEVPIREIPFFAAWFDWQLNQPATWQAMVEAGIITPDFIPWERRYVKEQFVLRNLAELDSNDSLLHYYTLANEEIKSYPADKDFICVTHPSEYMFPGLIDENDDRLNNVESLPIPREGDPVVRLGITHDVTRKDYIDKLLPSEEIIEKDTYIRPFKGFDAMSLMTVDNLFDKIPSHTENSITVMELSESLYLPDTKEVINFSRLKEYDMSKYGVVHICDRNYLFRATNGKLWEVRI